MDRQPQIGLDKGQEDDWFAPPGALGGAALATSLILDLALVDASQGLVDLHVLKDRNFRTGCF